jgi:hypothetical protein
MGLPLDSKTIKIQAMRQIGAINTKEKIEKISETILLTFLYIIVFPPFL